LLAFFNTKILVSKFRKLTTICFNTDVNGKGFNTTGGLDLGCIVSLSQVMIIVDIPHPDLAQFALILV
jgi:hypothetical protein